MQWHLHDSLNYLYDNPMVMYSQILVVAQKVEPQYEPANPYSEIYMKSAVAGGGSDSPYYSKYYDPDPNQQE